MPVAKTIFGALALGLATTVVLFLCLFVIVGGERASEILFGFSPAVLIALFAALWYPFVRHRLK